MTAPSDNDFDDHDFDVPPGDDLAPPAALRARMLDAVRKAPSPPRPIARKSVLLVALAASLWTITLFVHMGGVVRGQRPLGYILLTVFGWTAVALVATVGSVFRGRSMLGRPRALLVAVAAFVVPLLLGLALLGTFLWPETARLVCPVGNLLCLEYTTVLGLGPFLALFIARWRSVAVHARLTGAAFGAAAGAWGSVAMGAHCPFTAPLHVAVGHVLPAAVLAAAGAALGAWALAIRAEIRPR